MPYDMQVIEVAAGASTGAMLPALGLVAPVHPPRLGEAGTDLLIGLRLDHLRVDLDLERDGWADTLAKVARVGIETGTSLELALRLGERALSRLDEFDTAVRLAQVGVARYILQTGRGASAADLLETVRPVLTRLAPKASYALGSGGAGPGIASVRSYRWDSAHRWTAALEHEIPTVGDAVSGSIASPVVAPALGRSGRRPAGAAFALASIAALARSGASAITYSVRPGWGVIRRVRRAPAVTPAYHVLADLGEFEFGQVGEVASSDPTAVAALCAYTVEGVSVLVANTSQRPRRVLVEGLGRSGRVRTLDAASVRRAVGDPEGFRRARAARRSRQGRFQVDLDAYAVVRIDA